MGRYLPTFCLHCQLVSRFPSRHRTKHPSVIRQWQTIVVCAHCAPCVCNVNISPGMHLDSRCWNIIMSGDNVAARRRASVGDERSHSAVACSLRIDTVTYESTLCSRSRTRRIPSWGPFAAIGRSRVTSLLVMRYSTWPCS